MLVASAAATCLEGNNDRTTTAALRLSRGRGEDRGEGFTGHHASCALTNLVAQAVQRAWLP